MQNQIRLDANSLPGNLVQVTLTFDRKILLKDKIEGDNQLLYVFSKNIEEVTSLALLQNQDLINMPMVSQAIN